MCIQVKKKRYVKQMQNKKGVNIAVALAAIAGTALYFLGYKAIACLAIALFFVCETAAYSKAYRAEKSVKRKVFLVLSVCGVCASLILFIGAVV